MLRRLFDAFPELAFGLRVRGVSAVTLRKVADIDIERVEREPARLEGVGDLGDAALPDPVHLDRVEAGLAGAPEALQERSFGKEELEVGGEPQHGRSNPQIVER